MSDYKNIQLSVSNRVALVALNKPESLNSFNQSMRLELIEVVEKLEDDDGVRVVVVTGAGKAFSAGADLAESMSKPVNFEEQCAAQYTPWLMAIHNSKKLYIAAVNGACAGIGCSLAMNCDFIVMAEDAYLYQAFSAIGLMPDGGASWLLVNKLGYSRALQLAVEAGRLTAEECLQYGLANKVVASNKLLDSAQQWAEQLAAGAPLSQAYTKSVMRRVPAMTYKQVIEEEARLQTTLSQTQDVANGIRAFMAKQEPEFKGK